MILKFLRVFLAPVTLEEIDIPDDEDLDEKYFIPDDEKPVPIWTDVYALRSRQHSDIGNNKTAGSLAAVSICELVWKLGSFPTMEDFEVIIEFIEKENSVLAAWKLGNLINRQRADFKLVEFEKKRFESLFRSKKTNEVQRDLEYEERLMRILHQCCRMCLYGGFPDSCEHLINKMGEYDRKPDPALLTELEVYRAEREAEEIEKMQKSAAVTDPTAIGEEIAEHEEEIMEIETSQSASTEEENELEGFGGIEHLEGDDENEESEKEEESAYDFPPLEQKENKEDENVE